MLVFVKLRADVSVAVVLELLVRVVKEVERREAELECLALRDVKVLKEREIAVEERRSVNVRPDKLPCCPAPGA